MLGLTVAIGRGFRPEENQPGAARSRSSVTGFWQRVFGGDPAVLGRTITTGGIAYTIVGVASPSRRCPNRPTSYFPMEFTDTYDAATQSRRSEFLAVIGRAKAGVTRRRSMPT